MPGGQWVVMHRCTEWVAFIVMHQPLLLCEGIQSCAHVHINGYVTRVWLNLEKSDAIALSMRLGDRDGGKMELGWDLPKHHFKGTVL